MLLLRISLFISMVIFIPFAKLSSRILLNFEDKLIISNINKILNEFIKESPGSKDFFRYISKGIVYAFAEKDTFFVYTSLFYVLVEPFIIIKVLLVSNLSNYFFFMLRLLYQEYRPFWKIKDNYNSLCETAFSSPSLEIASACSFWLYLILQLLIIQKKKEPSSSSKRYSYILISMFFIIIILLSLDLIINMQNYIYQIIFALVLSLFFIAVLFDLDAYIHNYLLKSMKNLYNIRKYKIIFLIYMLLMLTFSILIYNIIPDDPKLNQFKFNINNTNVGLVTFNLGILFECRQRYW
jgi:hypothetical protein